MRMGVAKKKSRKLKKVKNMQMDQDNVNEYFALKLIIDVESVECSGAPKRVRDRGEFEASLSIKLKKKKRLIAV